ncbi:F-box/kelch-repeat protein At3g06240-like [Silene latifolia]|uniref:F-box/kelch-repeat protein At3g06240-like n=1 Tax=Silene latifolia TaxID=37657 RepID=UPI003D770BC6
MKRSKSPTTSSKFLPPEVWNQILSKFPAKTLLKFRCVCKYWRSIIDNPNFVQIHFQHSQFNSENNRLLVALEGMGCSGDQGYLLTVRDAQTLGIFDRIFRTHSYKYRIITSCNGLLLVAQFRYNYNQEEELRLWNPSIRKSLILPTCPFRPYSLDGLNCYLFGIAPSSKDYKVVAFKFKVDDTLGEEGKKMLLAVYTLSNRQWTVRNDPVNFTNLNIISMDGLFCNLSTAVFFRGATYWLGNNDKQRRLLTHLCSFDFDAENITCLELPFSVDEKCFFLFLFLLGESLAIFRISPITCSIWVLDQDNEKGTWTLRFSGKSSWDGFKVFNLCYVKCRKVLYCETDGGYFVCGDKTYNIASCKVEPLKISMSSHFYLETYSESLALSTGYGSRDLRSFP